MDIDHIDQIVKKCINDPEFREALASRLKKTLLPWEPMRPDQPMPQFKRENLLGDMVARGHKSTRDMREGDKSLVEQGFILLNEEDIG